MDFLYTQRGHHAAGEGQRNKSLELPTAERSLVVYKAVVVCQGANHKGLDNVSRIKNLEGRGHSEVSGDRKR